MSYVNDNKLNLAIKFLKLDTYDLLNKKEMNDFLNACKFFKSDVDLLISNIYLHYYVKDITKYQSSYIFGQLYAYGVTCTILNNCVSEKIVLNNSGMLQLLSENERVRIVQRYVRLAKRKFKELIQLYDQYVLINSLRIGQSMVNDLCIYECNLLNLEYYRMIIKFENEEFFYFNNIIPPHNISKSIIKIIKKELQSI